jgi:hypothetical protein
VFCAAIAGALIGGLFDYGRQVYGNYAAVAKCARYYCWLLYSSNPSSCGS